MSTETQAPDPAPSMSFSDAVRIASGCKDYGGGYRGTDYFEAYQHGIATVVASLRAAAEKGLQDTQVRALHTIGADSAPAIPAPEGADPAAWLVTWKGEKHEYVHAHASELPAVDQARIMGGKCEPLYRAAPAPQDSLDSAQPSKGVAMQAPQAPAWQPIETAPKERGGLVDIICNERRYTGCHYDRICDEYRHITACGVLIRLKGATHWMPIPAAPQTKEPKA